MEIVLTFGMTYYGILAKWIEEDLFVVVCSDLDLISDSQFNGKNIETVCLIDMLTFFLNLFLEKQENFIPTITLQGK